jgi:hypothetical protein
VYTQPDPEEHRSVPLGDQELAYPQHRHDASGRLMPEVLWALLMTVSMLMLLVSGPPKAPPFASLTVYACDPLQVMISGRYFGNRSVSTVVLTCRSENQVVYQRGRWITNLVNPSGWNNCRRAGGLVKIWRHANPSPYGNIAFQVTCNNEIFIAYKDTAAIYETNQEFSRLVAWILILLSGGVIAHRIVRRIRSRSNTMFPPAP